MVDICSGGVRSDMCRGCAKRWDRSPVLDDTEVPKNLNPDAANSETGDGKPDKTDSLATKKEQD